MFRPNFSKTQDGVSRAVYRASGKSRQSSVVAILMSGRYYVSAFFLPKTNGEKLCKDTDPPDVSLKFVFYKSDVENSSTSKFPWLGPIFHMNNCSSEPLCLPKILDPIEEIFMADGFCNLLL